MTRPTIPREPSTHQAGANRLIGPPVGSADGTISEFGALLYGVNAYVERAWDALAAEGLREALIEAARAGQFAVAYATGWVESELRS